MPQKREISVIGDVAIVPLTRGLFAMVDACDLDKVIGHNWFAVVQDHGAYAMRRVPGVKGRGSKISMHRSIMDAPDGLQVDHADLDGLNNRRSNLRLASPSENSTNRRKSKLNTSGYKGVCWNKSSTKWQAAFAKKYIGLFDTAEEAYEAYCEEALKCRPEFARVL